MVTQSKTHKSLKKRKEIVNKAMNNVFVLLKKITVFIYKAEKSKHSYDKCWRFSW